MNRVLLTGRGLLRGLTMLGIGLFVLEVRYIRNYYCGATK